MISSTRFYRDRTASNRKLPRIIGTAIARIGRARGFEISRYYWRDVTQQGSRAPPLAGPTSKAAPTSRHGGVADGYGARVRCMQFAFRGAWVEGSRAAMRTAHGVVVSRIATSVSASPRSRRCYMHSWRAENRN